MENMENELNKIISSLNKLNDEEKEILSFDVMLNIPRAFKLNLFFTEEYDKPQYVKDFLTRKLFLPHYPHSLNLKKYEIVDSTFGPDKMICTFELKREEYVQYLCSRIKGLLL